MAFDTVANIVSDVAIELGIYTVDMPDPFAVTDTNVIQLCRLLKGVGQDLARDYQWTHLQLEYVFSTSIGVSSYTLPDQYLRVIDQTQYNRTGQRRLEGPLSPQGWQYMKALSSTGTVEFYYRVTGTEFRLHPTPSSVVSIVLEYMSGYWVQSLDAVNPDKDAPTSGEDILCFDRRLLVCGLKLAFMRAKGFDATAAKADFDEALARARGADGAAPVLNINARGPIPERLVSPGSLPDTGFGT